MTRALLYGVPVSLLLWAGIVAGVVALTGCTERAVSTEPTNNYDVPVHLLFEHDACRVYRFWDAGWRYFADCRGSMSWDEACGKGCVRHNEVPTHAP